jgi:hypothetical protein
MPTPLQRKFLGGRVGRGILVVVLGFALGGGLGGARDLGAINLCKPEC